MGAPLGSAAVVSWPGSLAQTCVPPSRNSFHRGGLRRRGWVSFGVPRFSFLAAYRRGTSQLRSVKCRGWRQDPALLLPERAWAEGHRARPVLLVCL